MQNSDRKFNCKELGEIILYPRDVTLVRNGKKQWVDLRLTDEAKSRIGATRQNINVAGYAPDIRGYFREGINRHARQSGIKALTP